MNQTPYSVYFSIRKKFVKGHVPKVAPAEPNTCEKESLETNIFNIRHEYNKLYQASASEISRLNYELSKKSEIEETSVELKETNGKLDLENKHLKNEISDIKEKYEKKCKEVKVIKDEINVVKQDKNSTSVALARCRKEQTETIKTHEKKLNSYENKLNELLEYRDKKLSEERDVKIKQRKELKRAKRQQSVERKKIEDKDDTISSDLEEKDFNLNIPTYNPFDSLRSYKSLETLSSVVSSASKSSSSSSDLSSPVNTSQPVPLSTSDSITHNQDWNTKKQEKQEQILAALKLFDSSLNKCLEVTGQLT